jgi:hypothetical protein
MSSPYRKFVGPTQKKKIKHATKPETNQLVLNTPLVFQKGGMDLQGSNIV